MFVTAALFYSTRARFFYNKPKRSKPEGMENEHMQRQSLGLGNLAKALRARLPPELREIIYSHVLKGEVMDSLQKRSNNLWRGWARTKSTLPPFLNSTIVGPEFATEMIACFYKNCKTFSVSSPSLIRVLLPHDYFGHGITLSNVTIPALTVHIYARSEKGRDLPQDFEMLLSEDQQQWARNFRLTIILEKVVSENNQTKVADTIDDIWHLVVALRPIVETVKQRSGDVNVQLELGDCSTRGSWRQNVTTMMDDPHEVWEHVVAGIVAELWKDHR